MIDTILLDIDGTVMFRGAAVPGAPEAVLELERLGLKVKLLTNISERRPDSIALELQSLGFSNVRPNHIHTSTTAAVQLLKQAGASYSDLMIPHGVRSLFCDLRLDREAPDYLVVGDMSTEFTYSRMNSAFNLLKAGSKLVAMHKNTHWLGADGPMMDCGGYVTALEYAAGVEAIVSGKPSRTFFESVMIELGSSPSSALIVGDDRETDILGGHRIGARTVLVLTGKGGVVNPNASRPDHIAASVADLPDLVRSLH